MIPVSTVYPSYEEMMGSGHGQEEDEEKGEVGPEEEGCEQVSAREETVE